MSSTLVIADLHLSPEAPQITDCFLQFLKKEQGQHQALYILGDLFEAWIGDDDINPFTTQIAHAIHEFSDTTPVFFSHGNRDFLLGNRYARRCGMTLLPELYQTEVYGQQVIFMHGDQLCIDDVAYQKFRKKSRSWWWQAIMKAFPLSYRRQTAIKMRNKSRMSQMQKAEYIMDVATREVIRVMNEHQVDLLIHGHTHRPAIHAMDNGSKRIVVGDWYTQGSVLTLTESDQTLSTLPFN
jgi:UDP-2,3-diacylglucosamine hydrolase